MLAVAYELKSPKVGEWTKQGWLEGWKNLGYVMFLKQEFCS
jgi:DCN1-like protein 1/2